jgi:hypothetical protein
MTARATAKVAIRPITTTSAQTMAGFAKGRSRLTQRRTFMGEFP